MKFNSSSNGLLITLGKCTANVFLGKTIVYVSSTPAISIKQLTANKLCCSGCLSVSVPSFDYFHLFSFSKEKKVPELLNVQSEGCTKTYDLLTKTVSKTYFNKSEKKIE